MRVGAHLISGGMMFQRVRKGLPPRSCQVKFLCRWNLQHASPARLDQTGKCNQEEAILQITLLHIRALKVKTSTLNWTLKQTAHKAVFLTCILLRAYIIAQVNAFCTNCCFQIPLKGSPRCRMHYSSLNGRWLEQVTREVTMTIHHSQLTMAN